MEDFESNYTLGNETEDWSNFSASWDNSTVVLLPTKLPKGLREMDISIRIIQSMLALFGNTLTLATVIRYDFLQTTTNILICGLATADIVGGIAPIFMLARQLARSFFPMWQVYCIGETSLSLLSSFLNVMFTTLVSIDRYLYIAFPFRYPVIVTKRMILGALALVWIVQIGQVIIMTSPGPKFPKNLRCHTRFVFTHPNTSIVAQWEFVICTILTFIMYGMISCIACKQIRMVHGTQPSEAQVQIRKGDMRVTKMMIMVLGFYFASYVPHVLILAFIGKLEYEPVGIIILERFLSWIWWVSSWVNPIIYAWKSKELSRGFRMMLGFKLPTRDD